MQQGPDDMVPWEAPDLCFFLKLEQAIFYTFVNTCSRNSYDGA